MIKGVRLNAILNEDPVGAGLETEFISFCVDRTEFREGLTGMRKFGDISNPNACLNLLIALLQRKNVAVRGQLIAKHRVQFASSDFLGYRCGL